MIYSGDLLKINGTTIRAIVSYKVGRNKLWKNADRNMEGDVRATLIGIFPKIQLQIGYTTEAELSQLVSLLDEAFFNVTWFDIKIRGTHTAQYYASDYDVDMHLKHKGQYKPFTVNLVPVSRR